MYSNAWENSVRVNAVQIENGLSDGQCEHVPLSLDIASSSSSSIFSSSSSSIGAREAACSSCMAIVDECCDFMWCEWFRWCWCSASLCEVLALVGPALMLLPLSNGVGDDGDCDCDCDCDCDRDCDCCTLRCMNAKLLIPPEKRSFSDETPKSLASIRFRCCGDGGCWCARVAVDCCGGGGGNGGVGVFRSDFKRFEEFELTVASNDSDFALKFVGGRKWSCSRSGSLNAEL